MEIASAKANGVDPFAYLRDVLARLPILNPARPIPPDVTDLLPDRWLATHPEAHLALNCPA